MGSWKTTILGICALMIAIGTAGMALLDGSPATTMTLEPIIEAILGLGLMFARDNNVTSEQTGAK